MVEDKNIPKPIKEICEKLKDLYIENFSGKKVDNILYNTIKEISDKNKE